MEENCGLAVEMSKRLLKKPDATVDAVLKVNRSILLLKVAISKSLAYVFQVRGLQSVLIFSILVHLYSVMTDYCVFLS